MNEPWFRQLYTRMKTWRSIFVGIAVGLGIGLSGAILWHIPVWSVPRADLSYKEHLELIDKYRGTLAQIVAGIGIAAGLIFTWRNLTVAREGQITERFTRAIDQLGATDGQGGKRLEIRLGGIYALERIARDSAKDHWPIMGVLTAYVRQHASCQPLPSSQDTSPEAADQTPEEDSQQPQSQPKPAPDIQAILTVLGRRTRRTRWYEKSWLDLHGTDLRGADLAGAYLAGADLRGAHLHGADLRGAHLQGADLLRAHLQGADLLRTHLQEADLRGAHLQRADLRGAHLECANLRGAHFHGADLRGAHLQEADLRGIELQSPTIRRLYLQQTNFLETNLEQAGLRRRRFRREREDSEDAHGLTREQIALAFTDPLPSLPVYLHPPP